MTTTPAAPATPAGPAPPKEVDLQEVAAFRFLPFVVDLFQGAPLRMSRGAHLPLRDPRALTAEVVDALREVISRGTLAALCRTGGWRAQLWVQPGVDDPLRDVRGVDPRLWAGAGRRLEFGPQTLDALLVAYNSVCASSSAGEPVKSSNKGRTRVKAELATPEFDDARSGDVLVRHIIWWRLRASNVQVPEGTWQLLTRDPLTRLARLDARDVPAEAVVARLLAPDMEACWPWLGDHVVACWERELATCWDSLARFDRLNEGLASFGEAWVEAAARAGRRDWLRLLLRLMRRHFAASHVEERGLREFNRLSRDLKLSDRERYRRTWARWVTLAMVLQREYEAARQLHPIEREAPDKAWMEAVEAAPYTDLAWRAQAFANQLNGVIT